MEVVLHNKNNIEHRLLQLWECKMTPNSSYFESNFSLLQSLGSQPRYPAHEEVLKITCKYNVQKKAKNRKAIVQQQSLLNAELITFE